MFTGPGRLEAVVLQSPENYRHVLGSRQGAVVEAKVTNFHLFFSQLFTFALSHFRIDQRSFALYGVGLLCVTAL